MTPMRRAALELLPEGQGVFLRCDRGSALYVTNAPGRTGAVINWAAAGWSCTERAGLAFLVPEDRWIGLFMQWARGQVRSAWMTGETENASFGGILPEDRALWIEGVKRLELHGDVSGYEKLVRQRAAVCLREKRGGGSIAACALIVDLMHEGGYTDED